MKDSTVSKETSMRESKVISKISMRHFTVLKEIGSKAVIKRIKTFVSWAECGLFNGFAFSSFIRRNSQRHCDGRTLRELSLDCTKSANHGMLLVEPLFKIYRYFN